MNLKLIRQDKGLTQQDVASAINVSAQAYSHYETGRRQPDPETLNKLANYFNVSIDYLIGREDPNVEGVKFNRDIIKVPIYGEIPAGVPIDMIEDSFIEDYEEIDATLTRGDKVFFGLKIKGNSMYPEFRDGDNVIFQKADDCESGSFCAVSINHTECTFKKVIKKESGLTLMPLNSDFEPLFFTNKEVEEFPITILGIVKEVRRSY